MKRLFSDLVSSVSCLAAVALAAPAMAQTAAAGTDGPEAAALDEIVVTAQHRSENVQTTPLSIAALGGDVLAARQIDNVQALAAAVPNVNFGTYNGSARVSIRGIGDDAIAPGSEARVAFHLDGAYLSRPQSTMASFFDVDRVEVVRGPQGTLYGRNATAGAINVLTRDPTDTLDGYISGTIGNYDLRKGEAAVGGPIAENLSARVAGQVVSRGGFGRNITAGGPVDDQDTWGVRGKLKYDFSPDANIILAVDHSEQHDHSGGWNYFGQGSPFVTPFANAQGGVVLENTYDTSGNIPSKTDRITTGMSATLNVDMGWATLTSISAFRHLDTRTVTDYDMSNLDLAIYDIREASKQYSQELRLQGEYGRGHWLVGAYYFRERGNGSLAIPLDQALYFGPPGYVQGYYIEGNYGTNAYAMFGQADFEIVDGLSIVVGGRYSSEKKTLDEGLAFDTVTPFTGMIAPGPLFTNSGSKRWSDFTPRVSLEFKPADNVFLYATFSQGFKSGGFNLGGLQAPFNPENLTDYEVGLKAEWFDRRLRTNVSVFAYDYKDLQVSKVLGALIVVDNAARAKLYGAEFDITAMPLQGLELAANLALLHSKYTDFCNQDPARPSGPAAPQCPGDPLAFDLSGNKLNQSPDYSISLSAQYTASLPFGELTLRGEAYIVDNYYFTPLNQSFVGQAAYEKYNAFVTFKPESGNWSLQGYVRNIGNKRTKASSVVGSGLAGFPISGSYDPPRTYGVELRYNF